MQEQRYVPNTPERVTRWVCRECWSRDCVIIERLRPGMHLPERAPAGCPFGRLGGKPKWVKE